MNLHPELLSTLTTLGVTEIELDTLRSRMLSAVTSLQSNLAALDSQIATLNGQRNDILAELGAANVTVGKLVDLTQVESTDEVISLQ